MYSKTGPLRSLYWTATRHLQQVLNANYQSSNSGFIHTEELHTPLRLFSLIYIMLYNVNNTHLLATSQSQMQILTINKPLFIYLYYLLLDIPCLLKTIFSVILRGRK